MKWLKIKNKNDFFFLKKLQIQMFKKPKRKSTARSTTAQPSTDSEDDTVVVTSSTVKKQKIASLSVSNKTSAKPVEEVFGLDYSVSGISTSISNDSAVLKND